MTKLLIDVLSLPSFSSKEKMVATFIEGFCKENNIYYEKDYKGNIYVAKGTAEYYPCVVAHMDTVHKDQVELVDREIPLSIIESIEDNLTILSAVNPITGQPTGIGGDDKCGVYICLELLNKIKNIKAAFFVEEECGMLGSKNLNTKFFKDVGYALQFDAPTNNWFSYSCSGVRLWSEEFFDIVSPVLNEYFIDNISYDPFTDVVQIRKHFDFCCAVLPTGYYDQHSVDEYVVKEHTLDCVEIGKKFIEYLGEERYIFIEDKSSKPNELDNFVYHDFEEVSDEDKILFEKFILENFENSEENIEEDESELFIDFWDSVKDTRYDF